MRVRGASSHGTCLPAPIRPFTENNYSSTSWIPARNIGKPQKLKSPLVRARTRAPWPHSRVPTLRPKYCLPTVSATLIHPIISRKPLPTEIEKLDNTTSVFLHREFEQFDHDVIRSLLLRTTSFGDSVVIVRPGECHSVFCLSGFGARI